VNVTTTTHFAPGKAGAGEGGGVSDGEAQVIELGAKTGDRASGMRLAKKLGVPWKKVSGEFDKAVGDYDKKAAAGEKTAATDDARTVTLEDGNPLKLASPRAVTVFEKGYASQLNAREKLQKYRDFMAANGVQVFGEKAAERDALAKDAIAAATTISPMGSSDHAAHIEEGTLGPKGGVTDWLMGQGPDVTVKILDEKIKTLNNNINNQLNILRKSGGSEQKSGFAESKAPTGASKAPTVTETRVLPDGRKIEMLSDGSKRLAK
jgi:hypothetical protein